jgi:hypothetical protein
MRIRRGRARRVVVLLLALLALVVVREVYYFYLGVPVNLDLAGILGKPASGPGRVNDIVFDAPARAHGGVVWLKPNGADLFEQNGLIAEELFRQAVLIAARDEMGMQTRDAGLREWEGKAPSGNAIAMEFSGSEARLEYAHQGKKDVRWRHDYGNDWPKYDLVKATEMIEKLTRGELVDALRKDGWSGSGHVEKADAPAPEDAEKRLMEMEELSQFAVLRETSAAVEEDGESLPRLGVVVRAYANLGQLTRYHWSREYAVYTARSLLYAQRMVVKYPGSAEALWDRAYALAMAGLLGGLKRI